jgi:ribosome-interacting GTPase 1
LLSSEFFDFLFFLSSFLLISSLILFSITYFRRKEKGPINFQAVVPQSVLTQQIVLSICREYRIMSADIICRCDATIDQLIDVIEGNRKYIPCIYVLNKIDQLTIEE